MSHTTAVPSRLALVLGFAAIYVIWGSTYLAIRFAVETMPPFWMAGVRFLVGGLGFYFWARIKGAKTPTARQWYSMGIIGLFLLLGGNGLVTWAEQYVPSGLAALMIALAPMWITLFDWLFTQGLKPNAMAIAGLALGFFGVGALIDPINLTGLEHIDLFGAGALVLAPILWAFGSVYSRKANRPESHIMGVGMQMLVGSAGLFAFGLVTGEAGALNLDAISMKSVWGLVYLIIPGAIGYGAYVWLLQHVQASKVATYAYVNPVIALALGVWLADETLSSWTLGCSVVIVLAVFLIITSRAKKATSNNQDIPPVSNISATAVGARD